ncbi:3-hydroxyacyl-CoA dehydrogenase family protein [Vibrio sp. Of7-15]|uniref:3-hydroxyacyl-CoA dehydrogenase family protein n=1 Tax=Vibrio sp. Of7-15 TaxID=2724879 RepID=UPI001EF295FB|nr:3-hydroxyacyl-CoA dehydrogenase family protein [Vibrio sp. Of7-15]MCG7495628.1 3-hydroxyacyl-CoA dehydrogenase family protein [Vibrio sp. Of7-15]
MDTKMNIAIIGAGVMGADIAITFALYGHQVILHDINESALDAAKGALRGKLRMYKMMEPSLKDLSASDISTNIRYTSTLSNVKAADWVIENVPEVLSIKTEVYQSLAEICHPETMYAVNTSCISITKIASLMPDPTRVIGMHFMNPVPVKKGVEVIRGHLTSEETVVKSKALLKAVKKNAIVVQDLPGFVANRLSHLFMNEAAFLVQDKVANPAEIDAIFKQGYGHKMGPLETADLIGLDTVVQSLKVLYDSYQDPKFRCCPLLQRMVDAGETGRKSGKGFYQY